MAANSLSDILQRPRRREERAGISDFELFIRGIQNRRDEQKDQNPQQSNLEEQRLIKELIGILNQSDDFGADRSYNILRIIKELELSDERLTDKLLELLQNENRFVKKKAIYNIWMAYGSAKLDMGSLDMDMIEKQLKTVEPVLFLDLALRHHVAQENQSSENLTHTIIGLVGGKEPHMSWEGLRGMITEVRVAYGDNDTFVCEVQRIKLAIHDTSKQMSFQACLDKAFGKDFRVLIGQGLEHYKCT